MGKTRFETIEKERFEDKLKKMVPNSYTQKLTLHLKPFQDYADKIAEENVIIENDERERDRLLQVIILLFLPTRGDNMIYAWNMQSIPHSNV